jgi:hypothetical protein
MMEAARETFYRGGGFDQLGAEFLNLSFFAVVAVILAIQSLTRLLKAQ